PLTYGLGNRRSIHLSYERKFLRNIDSCRLDGQSSAQQLYQPIAYCKTYLQSRKSLALITLVVKCCIEVSRQNL
ncbi:MAG TPA: hypothetical protein PLK08_06600, partial [Phycisphaerae bacterium]|nr:hypothetical protein [Phycisphaerae bacterium]